MRPKVQQGPRGAALSGMVVGTGAVGMVTLGAIAALQAAALEGTKVTDVILVGLELILVPMIVAVWKRQDKLEQKEADARKALYEKMDELGRDLNSRTEKSAEQFGRLLERSEATQRSIAMMEERLEGVGSKIGNQTEKALQSRAEEFDRRFSVLEKALRYHPEAA